MKPMTKKAAKAEAVAAAKYEAYKKKVRALAGWVTVSEAVIAAYYNDDVTAEDCAIEYACQTAVGAAIWPLKLAAVQHAAKMARENIKLMADKLARADWNLDTVAPSPRYNDSNYRAASERRASYYSVFEIATDGNVMTAKHIAKRDPKRELKYIAAAEENAAYQYNLFVLKLVNKIGEGAYSATLTGDHVWSWSILTVTMLNGRIDRWKTQQITNCSKLGLWFPQWPSRLMKG